MHLIYLYVVVLPVFPDVSLLEFWMAPVMPLGLGGLWLAFYLWNLRRYPLLALHDANQAKALHFHEHDVEAANSSPEAQHG
jgi:hypothetical protein